MPESRSFSRYFHGPGGAIQEQQSGKVTTVAASVCHAADVAGLPSSFISRFMEPAT